MDDNILKKQGKADIKRKLLTTENAIWPFFKIYWQSFKYKQILIALIDLF